MRLTRCHIDAPLQPGTEIALPGRSADHLLKVLRLRPGDACVLFNGDGRDYAARLAAADKRGARAEILESRPVGNESPLRIVLLQGVARGEKMDLILQKATELGVAAILPAFAERSEVKLDAERALKRAAHWHSVVVAACEQSGRARLPALAPPAALAEAVRGVPADAELRLMLDPFGEYTLASLPHPVPTPAGANLGTGIRLDASTDAGIDSSAGADTGACPGTVAIAIGPEGGWSPRDRQTLRDGGFAGLRLGPRILRTETAGLAAIAALQARFGDL